MTIQELIKVLRDIDIDQSIDDLGQEICLNWGTLSERNKLVQDATHLATELLINDNGERNFENEFKLRMEGYSVFPLEQDSCGWLVGGIMTPKGIIAYG